MAKNYNVAIAFMERKMGAAINDCPPVPISPWRLIELMWPLNDIFRPHIHKIRTLSYDPSYEEQADEAIDAFAEQPEYSTWECLPGPVWRVLLERHQQMLSVAALNEANGTPSITRLPLPLPHRDRLPALMLLMLRSMKFPFPPEDRSRLELPQGSPAQSLRPH